MRKNYIKKGLTVVIIALFIGMGITSSSGNMITSDDTTAPVTTHTLDPPKPDGLNGWYVSDVTVTLNATDNSGVLETYYRINSGDWEIYYYPFVISEEGDNILIEYYSVDIHGNKEDVKSATLDIDKTPPEITFRFEKEKIGWRKWRVTFWARAWDNISGMEKLEFYINDGLQKIITGPGPEYVFELLYIPWGRKWTAGVAAYDFAGNHATAKAGSSDISSIVKTNSLVKQYPFYFQGILGKFPFIKRMVDILGRIF